MQNDVMNNKGFLCHALAFETCYYNEYIGGRGGVAGVLVPNVVFSLNLTGGKLMPPD